MFTLLLPVVAIVASAIATLTDLRTGRIPNKLTYSTLLIGFVLQSSGKGMVGAIESLLGIAVCAAVPGIAYQASQGRAIGGGDIKLFAALGALLGPSRGLEVELSSLMLIGLYAILRLAFEGVLARTLLQSARLCLGLVSKRARHGASAVSPVLTEMRMGLSVLLGVTTVLALPYVARWVPWLG